MNPAPIDWLSILYWTVGGAIALLVTLVVISACRLSSMISRDEEDRETRATFDRIKRVA